MVHQCKECGHHKLFRNEGTFVAHYKCENCGYVHQVNFFELQAEKISLMQENVESILYALIAVLTPFLLGHNQILTGTIVNTMLVLAALNLKTYKILPIMILPSIATLSIGLLFGSLTPYLVWMILPIWAGNFLLVYVIKTLYLHLKKNKWMTAIVASIMKAAFLFLVAMILVLTQGMPAVFLTAMGGMQLITALLGAFVAFGIQHGKHIFKP
jgi:hypothetical protein